MNLNLSQKFLKRCHIFSKVLVRTGYETRSENKYIYLTVKVPSNDQIHVQHISVGTTNISSQEIFLTKMFIHKLT